MAKIKIALEIENQEQLEQLERQLKNVREQVLGINPEKIKIDIEPIDKVQADRITRQISDIRKQSLAGVKSAAAPESLTAAGQIPASKKSVEKIPGRDVPAIQPVFPEIKDITKDISGANAEGKPRHKISFRQEQYVEPVIRDYEDLSGHQAELVKASEEVERIKKEQADEIIRQIENTRKEPQIVSKQMPAPVQLSKQVPGQPVEKTPLKNVTANLTESIVPPTPPEIRNIPKDVGGLNIAGKNLQQQDEDIGSAIDRDIDRLESQMSGIKERIFAEKEKQFHIEPITEEDVNLAERRMELIRDMVVSIEPDRIKNVSITEDQEEAVVALSRRIREMSAGELGRVRLSKEQLDLLKKQNVESRITLQSDMESLKTKKESAGWFDRSDIEETEKQNKAELAQEKVLARRLKYVEGIQKAETRAFAEMDIAEKSVDGKQTIIGGLASGAMRGMGLGGLMKISGPLMAAYGAYKTVQFVSQSMDTAGNFMTNIDRLALLTGQMADSAQKEIPMWRERALTMGTTVNQSVELTKLTSETVGYTKLHSREMESVAKELKVRGRDVARELPMFIDMMRRSPGMTLGPEFIRRTEAYAGAAGISGSRIFTQFLPMIQSYQNIMFSRGVEIPTDTLMRSAAGISQFGESFRGEQGAQILAGLSQTFMAGGGAGESGKGLIYRALMSKGMDYYGIQRAMSSGNVMSYMGDIIKEVQSEYGSIKPGTMGLLSLQALFPNLSVPQWERIMRNYKEGSPFDIKDLGNIIAKQGPDSKEETFMKTYLKSSIQSQVEKEIFQDAVAGGLEKWWTDAKGTVFGWLNRPNPLEGLLKSDQDKVTESMMKYSGWAAHKSQYAEHYDVGISGMNRGVTR